MEKEQYIEQVKAWLDDANARQAMLIWTCVKTMLKK